MAAEDELVERFGGTWSHEEACSWSARALEDSARIFQTRGVDLGVDDIVDTSPTACSSRSPSGVPFRPGARELLAELRDAGIPTALVTMSMRRMAEHVVDSIEFDALRRRRRRRRVDAAEAASRALPARPPSCSASTRATASRSRTREPARLRGRLRRRRRSACRCTSRCRRARRYALWAEPRRRRALADLARAARERGDATDDARRPSGPFRVGDRVQLTGPKGRLHTITLEPGKRAPHPPRRARARRAHRPARRLGRHEQRTATSTSRCARCCATS